MKHGLFYGSHDLTVDSKNRLLIPSDVRKCIVPERDGSAFFLIVGINKKPWLFTERLYEQMAGEQASEMIPGDDALAMDQMWYAQASRLEWDGQSRILIPEKFFKRTGIGKDVSLVGMRNHLEVWNRVDWIAREEELDQQRIEISMRAKQAKAAMQAPTGVFTLR